MNLTAWLDALDSARARWKGASQAERAAITLWQVRAFQRTLTDRPTV